MDLPVLNQTNINRLKRDCEHISNVHWQLPSRIKSVPGQARQPHTRVACRGGTEDFPFGQKIRERPTQHAETPKTGKRFIVTVVSNPRLTRRILLLHNDSGAKRAFTTMRLIRRFTPVWLSSKPIGRQHLRSRRNR